ncbi:isochorismatase family protein [Halotalea alkalilenta]|nr:isochorismatase family protein [Halotalea alkalilenta]
MTIPAITPYPMPGAEARPDNRVDWRPEAGRAALLIHDMQEYFLDKYYRDQAPIPMLLDHTRQLLDHARANGIPVFYTAQPTEQPDSDRALLNDFWGPGLPAHPELYPIVARLAPTADEVVLTKWRYSAFQRSDLRAQLRELGRDQLIITGIYGHIGCMATALEAFMQDVQPFFVYDAVADFSASEHRMATDYVARNCGVSLTTADTIAALDSARGFDLAAFEAEIERLLETPLEEIPGDENLMLAGMDSIRLMSLAERLRREGIEVGFADLVEHATLDEWREIFRAGGMK